MYTKSEIFAHKLLGFEYVMIGCEEYFVSSINVDNYAEFLNEMLKKGYFENLDKVYELSDAISSAGLLNSKEYTFIFLVFIRVHISKDYRMVKENTGNENFVIYNSTEYNLMDDLEKSTPVNDKNNTLVYCGDFKDIRLPINASSCYCMFSNVVFPEEAKFGAGFNTKNIVDMSSMFLRASLPKNFSLGPKFITSNVINMNNMFCETRIRKGFNLGDNFNTSNVTSMQGMFRGMVNPMKFSLGENFDTSKVVSMSNMFSCSDIGNNFSLGKKFNTENVTDMENMFYSTLFLGDFSLGEKFNTKNVTNMKNMFTFANFKADFDMGENFDTNNVVDMTDMFYRVHLPENFKFPSLFRVNEDCKVYGAFKEMYPDIDVMDIFDS